MFRDLFSTLFWFPWLNFYSESFILQLMLVIAFFLLINSSNLFYVASYLFLIIMLVGIFLAYYNLEVLTGFLLVVEFTAFFIIILFLLSMNFESLSKNNVLSFFYFSIFLFLFFYFFIFFEFTVDNISFLNSINYWDDYYEASSNSVMNDIFGLYVSYYFINSFIFFLFVCLIFIASVVCIVLVKTSKFALYNATASFSHVLDFFNDTMSFDFLRKQNMSNQNKRKATTRLVKFKKLNVTKE